VSDFPWLTALAVVPLVGAAAVAAVPTGRDLLAKQVALVVSLVPLANTIAIALDFDNNTSAAFQFTET
jgi:NADH-quinone oxidoreductase subunit M